MTALLPRIRASGADAFVREGRPVIARPSCLTGDLLGEVKARRHQLLDEPVPGDFCGGCGSHLWWIETEQPQGWRCASCHPPEHLEGQFRVVAT